MSCPGGGVQVQVQVHKVQFTFTYKPEFVNVKHCSFVRVHVFARRSAVFLVVFVIMLQRVVCTQPAQRACHSCTRPLAFAPFAQLLPVENRSSCEHFSELESLNGRGAEERMLPVSHSFARKMDQAMDSHFYYYAAGCSDLYLKAGRIVVSRHRLHAAVVLTRMLHRNVSKGAALRNVTTVLQQFASGERFKRHGTLRRCGDVLASMVHSLFHMHIPCRGQTVDGAQASAALLRCRWTLMSDVFAGVLHEYIWDHMHALQLDTLVLLHEAPGGEAHPQERPLEWKTEIIRRDAFWRDTFYYRRSSGSFAACDLQSSSAGCTHCSRRQTPISVAACGSRLLGSMRQASRPGFCAVTTNGHDEEAPRSRMPLTPRERNASHRFVGSHTCRGSRLEQCCKSLRDALPRMRLLPVCILLAKVCRLQLFRDLPVGFAAP